MVVGKKDMTPFTDCHYPSPYGHAIQEQRARGEGCLDRVLKLVARAVLSETTARKAADKRKTDQDHQGPRGNDHS